MEVDEKVDEKIHAGRYKKGQSGNPGRRMTNPEFTRILMEYRDKRNECTLGLFNRIESIRDALITKAVDLALSGNERMLLFLLDKCINNNLINRLEKTLVSRTVEDIDNSQQFVIEKMGEGTIDVVHGLNLVKTLSLKRDTINVKQLEEQVGKIMEDDQATKQ